LVAEQLKRKGEDATPVIYGTEQSGKSSYLGYFLMREFPSMPMDLLKKYFPTTVQSSLILLVGGVNIWISSMGRNTSQQRQRWQQTTKTMMDRTTKVTMNTIRWRTTVAFKAIWDW
jgi:hypothetical protein